MTDLLKYSALAVFLLLGAGGSPAHAFRIVTEGGPKIQSDSGNFELGLNGSGASRRALLQPG